MTVWAKDSAKKEKDVVRIREHGPCSGLVADLRTNKLPSWDQTQTFYSELVIEFDLQNRVIRRWPMPVDTVVHGLSGYLIIVKLYNENEEDTIAINPAGEILRFNRKLSEEPVLLESCPTFSEFGETHYLTCYLFKDLESRMIRSLAFEGPCT